MDQNLDLDAKKWYQDPFFTKIFPAFTDTVDITYPWGTCGFKIISLDTPAPAFLSVINSSAGVAFAISYDWSAAVLTDIKVHTIPYTVTFLEYSSIAKAHTGSFTFEILCPDAPDSVTVNTAMEANSFYDVASGAILSIAVPAVDVIPTTCFTVSYWEVQDIRSGSTPTFVTMSSTSVDIETADRNNIGIKSLLIEGYLPNGSTVSLSNPNFEVEIYDSCSKTAIVQSEDIQDVTVKALDVDAVTKIYKSFTDTVSDGYGFVGSCGPLTYSLLRPVPSFVTLSYDLGGKMFSISIDASSYSNAITKTLTLEVALVDYPSNPRL